MKCDGLNEENSDKEKNLHGERDGRPILLQNQTAVLTVTTAELGVDFSLSYPAALVSFNNASPEI